MKLKQCRRKLSWISGITPAVCFKELRRTTRISRNSQIPSMRYELWRFVIISHMIATVMVKKQVNLAQVKFHYVVPRVLLTSQLCLCHFNEEIGYMYRECKALFLPEVRSTWTFIPSFYPWGRCLHLLLISRSSVPGVVLWDVTIWMFTAFV